MIENTPIYVFLDTNVYMKERYNFSAHGNLGYLKKHIDNETVSLLLSNIVINEVKSHIKEDITAALNKIKSGLQDLSVFRETNDYKSLLAFRAYDGDKMVSDAIAVFENYISETDAYIIDNQGIDLDSILFDYFQHKPPFENNAKKKSEFPDAFMAAKLKKRANKTNPLVVVSDDGGFRNALAHIDGITIFTDLKSLLDKINRENELSSIIIEYLTPNVIASIVVPLVDFELRDNEIEVDGYEYDRKGIIGGYEYDESYVDNVEDIVIEELSIDDFDDDTATVTFSGTATIYVHCTYFDEANSIWDSEDKKYIVSEYGNVDEEHRAPFDCTVVFQISKTDICPSSTTIHIRLDQDTRRHQEDD